MRMLPSTRQVLHSHIEHTVPHEPPMLLQAVRPAVEGPELFGPPEADLKPDRQETRARNRLGPGAPDRFHEICANVSGWPTSPSLVTVTPWAAQNPGAWGEAQWDQETAYEESVN